MGDRPTLIMTTRLGVRPLGVRGDPLHAVAGQLLSVIRRRLGDGPADLLAEPQLRETGDGIDWYAARSGAVRKLADLDESERAQVLRTVDSHLESIRSLGAVAQRPAVGAPSSAAAAGHVGAVGRVLAGRSAPQCRDDGAAGPARTRAAGRSHAGAEGLARRCAGRAEQAESPACRARDGSQEPARPLQADRTAQATAAPATHGQTPTP